MTTINHNLKRFADGVRLTDLDLHEIERLGYVTSTLPHVLTDKGRKVLGMPIRSHHDHKDDAVDKEIRGEGAY